MTTYVPKWCDEVGCVYVTAGTNTTKCALHEEAARVAASLEANEVGLRDWEWCDVPGCAGVSVAKWDELSVCATHSRYGAFVQDLRAERDRYRKAAITLAVATAGLLVAGLWRFVP